MPVPAEMFEKLPDKYDEQMPMEALRYKQLLIINYNYLKRNPLKVVKGRTLEENDFKKDFRKENIPILIGNEYLGFVEVGEEFDFSTLSKTRSNEGCNI